MLTPQQKNALANEFRREAQAEGIGSPFRQNEYIMARFNGHSRSKAVLIAKRGPSDRPKNNQRKP